MIRVLKICLGLYEKKEKQTVTWKRNMIAIDNLKRRMKENEERIRKEL